jgi:hypothetical protein
MKIKQDSFTLKTFAVAAITFAVGRVALAADGSVVKTDQHLRSVD